MILSPLLIFSVLNGIGLTTGVLVLLYGWYPQPLHDSCGRCRYSLRGLPTNASVCPECGSQIQFGRCVPQRTMRHRIAIGLGAACIAVLLLLDALAVSSVILLFAD